jgi:hypothetical protein
MEGVQGTRVESLTQKDHPGIARSKSESAQAAASIIET